MCISTSSISIPTWAKVVKILTIPVALIILNLLLYKFTTYYKKYKKQIIGASLIIWILAVLLPILNSFVSRSIAKC